MRNKKMKDEIKEPKNVKVNLQITDVERKAWKQYALDNDMTLTDAIKNAMQKMIAKSKKKNA